MPAPSSGKRRAPHTKRAARTAEPVREAAAAAAAVERVLASDDAFALLIRRLEAAGWRIEPAPEASAPGRRPPGTPAALTAPERTR